MKHTPGPWKVKENGKHETPSIWSANEFGMKREICRVKDAPGEYLGNARLIAAAPELLEALRDVVNSISFGDGVTCPFCGRELEEPTCNDDDCPGVKARAALSKVQS